MRHREQVRIIAVIALVCASLAFTIGLKAALDPSLAASPEPANQQKGDQKKKAQQRQDTQKDRQSRDNGDGPIKIDTEMVQLDVKVTDQNGQSVAGLTKSDFTVYDDKVSQNIESVSREEAPVSMGLVIDTSGSMGPRLVTVMEAARRLIRQMRPDDEAFLVQFKTDAELLHEFTSDQRALEDGLKKLYAHGGTALLDAIIATADYAQQNGKQRRKALVVISDGLDKNSSAKEKKVVEVMKQDEVQVYLVGYVQEDEPGMIFGGPGKRARDLLTRLAEDSGGRAFFPTDVSETPAIAAQIAKDLRSQYVVSYYPTNDKRDNGFHAIRVVVNHGDSRKLFARTRQGYFAR